LAEAVEIGGVFENAPDLAVFRHSFLCDIYAIYAGIVTVTVTVSVTVSARVRRASSTATCGRTLSRWPLRLSRPRGFLNFHHDWGL